MSRSDNVFYITEHFPRILCLDTRGFVPLLCQDSEIPFQTLVYDIMIIYPVFNFYLIFFFFSSEVDKIIT